jgi:hypothetical protein
MFVFDYFIATITAGREYKFKDIDVMLPRHFKFIISGLSYINYPLNIENKT